MIVPTAKDVQVLLGCRVPIHRPLAGQLFESPKESLHPAVLPRREGSRALMPDAEKTQPKTKECRREHRLVVGTDASRLTELLDRIKDLAKDRDRRLAPQVAQRQTGSRAVVEKPEDGALSLRPTDIRKIECPDDVWRHRSRPLVLELATDARKLVLTVPQHRRNERLADRHLSPTLVQMIKDDRDLSAAVKRHQRFKPQNLLVDPRRLGGVASSSRSRGLLDLSPWGARPKTGGTPAPKSQQRSKASQKKQDLR